MIRKYFPLLILLFGLISCTKELDQTPGTEKPGTSGSEDLNSVVAGENFGFKTEKIIEFEVILKSNIDEPLPGIRVKINSDFQVNAGYQMVSGFTGDDGAFRTSLSLPDYFEQVVVDLDYVGLPDETPVSVSEDFVQVLIGGSDPGYKSGEIGGILKNSLLQYTLMGGYNALGVPDYLEPQNDIIDSDFLADINATFPESQPINPVFLNAINDYDFKLTLECDVWITFVHEGAGYKNILGYYTYNLDNPPASSSQITNGRIIYPNVSYQGSGGGLHTGNKVYLGTFPANTGIGFFLIADGFRNGTLTGGYAVYYSNPAFNPESDPSKKKHSVIAVDMIRKYFLMGFEDLNRVTGSDHDFNDALFLVKANPREAINVTYIPPIIYNSNDQDGDGVPDNMDDYPTDPELAFDNFYPGEGVFGTLAFEDLWPSKGDYDFNDVVVDYNINQITNAQNKVVKVKPVIVPRASGAGFKNGFGIQLNVPSSSIAYVTGQEHHANIISLNANGTEAGQSKAVIIPFDHFFKVMPYSGNGSTGVNTNPAVPFIIPDTIKMELKMVTPVLPEALGLPPYNPFIFVNQTRGREVHLPDHLPTDMANGSYFGTFDDTSDPSEGRYYRSDNNLPWAISLIERFDYPIEKAPVNTAYLHFTQWIESGGTLYPDWFKDLPGYRNPLKIYNP